MTRAAQTVSIGLLVASLYTVCYLGLVPFPAIIQEEIIPVLPFTAVVAFGAMLLAELGWGVMTFNDVPKAHDELMQEIETARKELKAKGVSVD